MVELCSSVCVEGGGKLTKSRSMLVVTFRVVEVFLFPYAIVFVYYDYVCTYDSLQLFPRYSICSKAEA
jgi:hypothetical protein